MELNLNSLQAAGAFTGCPVEKEIKWNKDGKELSATAYVRKLSYKSAVSDVKQFGKDVIAGRIAACICDKGGIPVFSVEDITGYVVESEKDTEAEKKRKIAIIERGPLDHNLTIALLSAIAEVNSISGEVKT
ncbi:MAG TPA: phage tail assembly chaperone family protein, TAC [Patescibacteria group bacterium]|nr:phage tail assembly chaperone family protein, TAC [Patescibacteria group bacterium]